MKRKDIKKTIEEYFFVHPTSKLRVREIERVLKLPLPSVIRYCRELEREGLLSIHKTGKVVCYTSNRTNEKYILEKKLFNIKSLYESGLIEHIKQKLSNPVIIIFGSYAKGEDTEESDIDVYIETPSKFGLTLESFEKMLKRKIQIFRHASLKEVPNKNLSNSIINGVPLNGFVEVFR